MRDLYLNKDIDYAEAKNDLKRLQTEIDELKIKHQKEIEKIHFDYNEGDEIELIGNKSNKCPAKNCFGLGNINPEHKNHYS